MSSRFPAFPRTTLARSSIETESLAWMDGQQSVRARLLAKASLANSHTHPTMKNLSGAHTKLPPERRRKEKWQMSLYQNKKKTEDWEKLQDSENWRKNYYTISKRKSDENMRDVRGGVLAEATGNLAGVPLTYFSRQIIYCVFICVFLFMSRVNSISFKSIAK